MLWSSFSLLSLTLLTSSDSAASMVASPRTRKRRSRAAQVASGAAVALKASRNIKLRETRLSDDHQHLKACAAYNRLPFVCEEGQNRFTALRPVVLPLCVRGDQVLVFDKFDSVWAPAIFDSFIRRPRLGVSGVRLSEATPLRCRFVPWDFVRLP